MIEFKLELQISMRSFPSTNSTHKFRITRLRFELLKKDIFGNVRISQKRSRILLI